LQERRQAAARTVAPSLGNGAGRRRGREGREGSGGLRRGRRGFSSAMAGRPGAGLGAQERERVCVVSACACACVPLRSFELGSKLVSSGGCFWGEASGSMTSDSYRRAAAQVVTRREGETSRASPGPVWMFLVLFRVGGRCGRGGVGDQQEPMLCPWSAVCRPGFSGCWRQAGHTRIDLMQVDIGGQPDQLLTR
jgi:hypothetical protein